MGRRVFAVPRRRPTLRRSGNVPGCSRTDVTGGARRPPQPAVECARSWSSRRLLRCHSVGIVTSSYVPSALRPDLDHGRVSLAFRDRDGVVLALAPDARAHSDRAGEGPQQFFSQHDGLPGPTPSMPARSRRFRFPPGPLDDVQHHRSAAPRLAPATLLATDGPAQMPDLAVFTTSGGERKNIPSGGSLFRPSGPAALTSRRPPVHAGPLPHPVACASACARGRAWRRPRRRPRSPLRPGTPRRPLQVERPSPA